MKQWKTNLKVWFDAEFDRTIGQVRDNPILTVKNHTEYDHEYDWPSEDMYAQIDALGKYIRDEIGKLRAEVSKRVHSMTAHQGSYRKKPIEVKAVQWFPGIYITGAEIQCIWENGVPDAKVQSAEGWIKLSPGSWVVGPGAAGEYWPVMDDIFKATYEAVDD